MNIEKHEIGDFVKLIAPNGMILKKGLVVEDKKDSFCVQWMSYNKFYFDGMNGKNEIIQSLSKNYLLTKTSYHRTNETIKNIIILNKAKQYALG